MRQKMSLSSRGKQKRRILDEFVSGSGYHRKYAVTLLNQGIREAAYKEENASPLL